MWNFVSSDPMAKLKIYLSEKRDPPTLVDEIIRISGDFRKLREDYVSEMGSQRKAYNKLKEENAALVRQTEWMQDRIDFLESLLPAKQSTKTRSL